LGCFGTMCRYAAKGHEVHFLVLSQGEGGTEEGNRIDEAKQSAGLLKSHLHIEDLPDRYMTSGHETISTIEHHINAIQPDVVFIPSGNDTHQDHRAVYLASLVAARKVDEVYIYQSPSTTTDFKPTVYFDITDFMDQKMEAVRIHTSQSQKIYMADRAVKGLAEYRAFDVLKNDHFFEAFEVFRIIK
ncbi:PIG-L family deacetylase, partial [Candidatus Gracilibacteria bacterium]|nr:PIG-L family deacetylase [Candidatus Gracilibacteria bacterium]